LWYSNYQVKDKEKCLPAGKMGTGFLKWFFQNSKLILTFLDNSLSCGFKNIFH